MDALTASLGGDDAQRFIKLLVNACGDYTKLRKCLFHGITIEEISSEAKELWEKNNKKESVVVSNLLCK
jgi:hypothetical protein